MTNASYRVVDLGDIVDSHPTDRGTCRRPTRLLPTRRAHNYSISSGDYSSDWWVDVSFKPADAGVVAIRVRRAARTDRSVGYGSPISEMRVRYPEFREVAPFDDVRVSEGFIRLQSPADPRLFYFASVAETSAATIDWMQVGASPGYEGCPAG